MAKTQDLRRNLIVDARKGKMDDLTFHAVIKYHFDFASRTYILGHLSKRHFDIAYNSPKPESHALIRKNPSFISEDATLIGELKFFIESLSFYKTEINKFIQLNEVYEQSLLSSDFDKCFDVLDSMDDELGFSFHSILGEYLVNEQKGDFSANHDLLKSLNENGADSKVLILLNLTRYRVDQSVSSLSYEGAIEQHRKLYHEVEGAQYLDYLSFKFDHLHAIDFSNFSFILTFEGDFSIVDRYQTLKRLLPFMLSHDKIDDQQKSEIIFHCCEFSKGISDSYWTNFRTLYAGELGPYEDRSGYHLIQDSFFEGDYNAVVEKSADLLRKYPNHAELYLPFLQGLLHENKRIEEFLPMKNELSEILGMMKAVMEKGSNYNADRERLLKKYYSISHLNFSFHILEFVYNEYHLVIKRPVQLIAFLNSSILRYNTFKLFADEKQLISVLKANPYKTESYLLEIISGDAEVTMQTYLQMKVKIGYYVKRKKYLSAIRSLLAYKNDLGESFALSNHIHSWVQRNIIKCYLGLVELGKASDIVVESFFKTQQAFAQFIDPVLLRKLSDPFDTRFSEHITIPIMFEIYNSPQSEIYDVIANFLVANDVKRPTELIPHRENWDSVYFNYFLEKCCVKENLEDSPFFKNINLLEDERIKILNYLKVAVPEKIKEYNKEILTISQDASLRKGLLQIHESRIYVDTKSILKVREVNLRELFDTYTVLNDFEHSYTSMKLGDIPSSNSNGLTYYFKEAIDETTMTAYDLVMDHNRDPNAIRVPEIKYQYFVALFGYLKNFFVFDEDYGFKSFLSMRIRHGTFSNVLRTVFEKHNLVSSKASNTNNYQDIKFWDNIFENSDALNELQWLFKKFSSDIDQLIDTGLSWLTIKNSEAEDESGFFDFRFSDDEVFNLFRNRTGRLITYESLVDEVFKFLYDRLENCLSILRTEISEVLARDFVSLLDNLQREVSLLELAKEDAQTVDQYIVDCRTEIQAVISQIENWFSISKNRYIEEFPIELILDTIKNYINRIYSGALSKDPQTEVACDKNIKGKYFEPFGDVFINILENIITKNKDIIDDLDIHICIALENDQMTIKVDNNVSPGIKLNDLEGSIQDSRNKINNYKNGSDVAFEKGSGYVKLCKSIAVDLERKNYTVNPAYENGRFEVNVNFSTENLFS